VLMFVALLHGCPALYECAGRNMLTGGLSRGLRC
jgi:hypothetical protein